MKKTLIVALFALGTLSLTAQTGTGSGSGQTGSDSSRQTSGSRQTGSGTSGQSGSGGRMDSSASGSRNHGQGSGMKGKKKPLQPVAAKEQDQEAAPTAQVPALHLAAVQTDQEVILIILSKFCFCDFGKATLFGVAF